MANAAHHLHSGVKKFWGVPLIDPSLFQLGQNLQNESFDIKFKQYSKDMKPSESKQTAVKDLIIGN